MASLTSTGETKDSNTESSPLVELIVSDVNGIQSFLCPDENEFISGTISTGKTKLEPSALSWSDATPKPSQSAKSEMLHGSTAPKLCYSSNGAYVAITTENSITFQKIGEEVDIENVIQVKNVDFVAFSPLGTYCVTWSRLYKGEKEPNLRIWRVEDRSLVIEFMMVKQPADEAWPVIKFSPDESIAARAVTNEIHFYSNCKFADGPTNKLRLPGVCLFSISPGPSPQRIACFAPGKKGAPGRASMYRFGQFDQAIASKSFFRAEDCIFRWSPNGATVLVETRSSVDATGQSYMGESNLYLLSDRPGGSFEMKVPRTKDGPLHAVAWSPAGKEFAVIAGKMPPNVTLHNPRTGEPVFELGSAPRNTLSYSPQGRFLLVGGFGTLSGDMDFWDIYKRKKMGTRRSTLSVVDFGWSANGRWFQVASTYPRRQVENGYAVYGYNGELISKVVDASKLYKTFWRPALSGTHADRSSDKQVIERSKSDSVCSGGGGKGGYRPPGARKGGTGGGRSLSDMLGEKTSSTGAIKRSINKGRGGPVGASQTTEGGKNANKNKARKERQKRAKEAAELKLKQEAEEEAKRLKAEADQKAAKWNDPNLMTTPELNKSIKKLKKQLRAVDALKLKDSLNDAQKKKLATENNLKNNLKVFEDILASR